MVTCEHCRYFKSDEINPAAGMGRCMHDARHGYWHPDARHSCKDFSQRENERDQSPQRPAH